MGQFARDADGNVFTSDDGQTWKPAPMAQDEQGGKFYNDGTTWQPIEGSAAGGSARPAAAARVGSPSPPAAASPSVAGVDQGSPFMDELLGPRPQTPSTIVPPGGPGSWLNMMADIVRQGPYEAEETARGGLGMASHGAQALGEGKPSGIAGVAGGALQMAGAPFAPVYNPMFREVVDPFMTVPFEKATGMPHELSDAILGAAPLLGVRGGRVPGRRGAGPEILPPERQPAPSKPGPPEIEGEIVGEPPPAQQLPQTRALPKSKGAAQPAETVGEAAVQLPTGEVFTGANHGFAYDAAAAGVTQRTGKWHLSGDVEGAVDGFVTSTGRFVTRDEARSIAESNQQVSPDAPKTHGALTAEQLKSAKTAVNLPPEAIQKPLKPLRDVLGLGKEPFSLSDAERAIVEADEAGTAERISQQANLHQNTPYWVDIARGAKARGMSDVEIMRDVGIPKEFHKAVKTALRYPQGHGPTQFNAGIDPMAIRAVVDPTGMDANARQAESAIRDEVGMANRDTAITSDLLEAHQQRVNLMLPQEKYDLFRYIQNRRQGFPITDPTLQGLADLMRDAFKERELKLRNLPSTAQMGFYEDYLPQMVKDPRAMAGSGLGVKQGSGAFTKERFYETVDDLLAAGHELKTDNPIELVMDYVTNVDRYIALNQIIHDYEAAGEVAAVTDRRRVPDGWAPLQGRLGQKHGPAGAVQRYAPEGMARVWNNFVSQGAKGDWKNVYDMAQMTSNGIQALEFAFSQYHAFTVAMKAPVVELGRAFQAVRRGAPLTALKALAEAPLASITTPLKGRRARDIYLRRPGVRASAADREVVNILTRANHRFQGLDPSKEYEYSAMRDYWRSWKRGALKSELLNDWANMKADPIFGTPKMVFRHVGRIIQTTAKPVFEHYIPLLKNGAAFNSMKQWLELHPAASQAEKLKAARDIVDQIDNMMGEMVHDNLFWQRAQKQIAQLSLTSFSWTFGNLRWAAGAAADAPKAFMPRGDVSLRTATLLAYPIVLGTLSTILQYMMTGEPPKDETDLIAPRTGGKVRSGRNMVDERLMIPGSHKDWLGWYFHPQQELWNKAHRGLHIGAELYTGEDFRGDPLSAADKGTPQWIGDYFKHVFSQLMPIAGQQTSQGGKVGSHISDIARFIGFKEAPMPLQNPKGWRDWHAAEDRKSKRTKLRHDQQRERQYKGPVE